jgi:hypothetical protein
MMFIAEVEQCLLTERSWPDRCDRCISKGLPCSENQRTERKSKHYARERSSITTLPIGRCHGSGFVNRKIDHQSKAPIEGARSQNTVLSALHVEPAIEERMHNWYVNIYRCSGLLGLTATRTKLIFARTFLTVYHDIICDGFNRSHYIRDEMIHPFIPAWKPRHWLLGDRTEREEELLTFSQDLSVALNNTRRVLVADITRLKSDNNLQERLITLLAKQISRPRLLGVCYPYCSGKDAYILEELESEGLLCQEYMWRQDRIT